MGGELGWGGGGGGGGHSFYNTDGVTSSLTFVNWSDRLRLTIYG